MAGGLIVGGQSGGGIAMKMVGLLPLEKLLRELADEDDIMVEMEEATEDALGSVMAASQEIVPYDTGALHDSAFVTVFRAGNGRLMAFLGYDTHYAIYVHENPDAYHASPTRWKFLEEPFMRMQPQILARIARGVRERLARAA